ncbi:MAG: hypothetical protein L6R37_005025 [Teloschistes peruensis]|nr:MAG: hypothetical protein L6R37_005025 [Teloschistes peruensis]
MVDSPFQPSFQPLAGVAESTSIQAIIDGLGMMPHPEGGYFIETDRDPRNVPNPFPTSNSNATNGGSSHDLTRSASTTIFYLLTPSSPQGHFHRNKARTMHTLHKGRGRYVIVHADEEEHAKPVRVETFVVGQNVDKGERLQWMVEGGKYKASNLLSDQEGESKHNSEEGLLISEVRFLSLLQVTHQWELFPDFTLWLQTVVPGFDFADHDFMPRSRLAELVSEKQNKELEWLLLEQA